VATSSPYPTKEKWKRVRKEKDELENHQRKEKKQRSGGFFY
jgi:hypothetical protein